MLIYADTASPEDIERYDADDRIAGFTTNPTLFVRAGARSARKHALDLVGLTNKPISVDGPIDDVCDLGPHVMPKVPVTDPLAILPARPVNLTAVLTRKQVAIAVAHARPDDIVSVFAGRIADTGRDPLHLMHSWRQMIRSRLLWASAREVWHVDLATRAGCDIITLTPPLIDKLDCLGVSLEEMAAVTLDQFDVDRGGVPW